MPLEKRKRLRRLVSAQTENFRLRSNFWSFFFLRCPNFVRNRKRSGPKFELEPKSERKIENPVFWVSVEKKFVCFQKMILFLKLKLNKKNISWIKKNPKIRIDLEISRFFKKVNFLKIFAGCSIRVGWTQKCAENFNLNFTRSQRWFSNQIWSV